jgi:hypothetical protein
MEPIRFSHGGFVMTKELHGNAWLVLSCSLVMALFWYALH